MNLHLSRLPIALFTALNDRSFVRRRISLSDLLDSSSAALIYTEIHKGPKRSFLPHPRYVNSIVEQLVSGTGRSPLESRGRRYRIAGGGRKSVWGGRGGGGCATEDAGWLIREERREKGPGRREGGGDGMESGTRVSVTREEKETGR